MSGREFKENQRKLLAVVSVVAVFVCAVALILKGILMLLEIIGATIVMLVLNIGTAYLISRHEEKHSKMAFKKMRKTEKLEGKLPPFSKEQKQALFELIRLAVHDERSFWLTFFLNTLFFILGVVASYLILHP